VHRISDQVLDEHAEDYKRRLTALAALRGAA
jgi:hypothetical protein